MKCVLLSNHKTVEDITSQLHLLLLLLLYYCAAYSTQDQWQECH